MIEQAGTYIMSGFGNILGHNSPEEPNIAIPPHVADVYLSTRSRCVPLHSMLFAWSR